MLLKDEEEEEDEEEVEVNEPEEEEEEEDEEEFEEFDAAEGLFRFFLSLKTTTSVFCRLLRGAGTDGIKILM